MQARLFTLLGNSTLESVRGVAQGAVQRWANGWGVAPSAFVLECRRGQETALQDARWRRSWSEQGRSLWLGWEPELVNEIQRALFPPNGGYASHAPKPARLAPAGAEQAFEQLVAALAAAMAPGAVALQGGTHDEPGALEFANGAGSVQLQLRIGKQVCHLLLNGDAVRALAAHATPSSVAAVRMPKLAPLDYLAALHKVAVALPVHIGSAEVGLGSLMSAGIGDVVRLDTLVDAPVAVAGPDGEFLFEAYLGRVHDSVAIEIAGRY